MTSTEKKILNEWKKEYQRTNGEPSPSVTEHPDGTVDIGLWGGRETIDDVREMTKRLRLRPDFTSWVES